jgi:hypothetical protein
MEEADLFIHAMLSAAQRQQRVIGMLFVENFLTCGNFTDLCNAHCPENRQGRMQYDYAGESGNLNRAVFPGRRGGCQTPMVAVVPVLKRPETRDQGPVQTLLLLLLCLLLLQVQT